MNGKQAKMLRRIGASKKDRNRWSSLSSEEKGKARYAYDNYVKMTYPDIKYILREAK